MLNMKFFSVEGTNQLIPRLEVFIQQLRDIKKKILQKQIQIDTLLIVGGTTAPAAYAPGQEAVQKDIDELNNLIENFNNILENMDRMGCQLKDADLGLVDFFYIHQDKIVNLCWKSGETSVEFWHDLDKGYTTREKLV